MEIDEQCLKFLFWMLFFHTRENNIREKFMQYSEIWSFKHLFEWKKAFSMSEDVLNSEI